ncbi:MAG TPA: TlpA disulfide reductase family protein [Chthonomonadaceae bacterium]|nr:TlpA disulfide reductase family protein [Chthonomonadaceae bacterium]
MATGTPETGPRKAGSPVADFQLTGLDGKTYASKEARQKGLLLAALFKVGCGTCQYAAPYLQRLHELYAQKSGGRFQVWGISQDNAADTQAFAKEHGDLTFPLLLDSDLQTSVSYGPTNVPDLYLLGEGDTIATAITGYFSKDEYNALAKQVADFVGVPYVPIVRDEDNAPAIKPG